MPNSPTNPKKEPTSPASATSSDATTPSSPTNQEANFVDLTEKLRELVLMGILLNEDHDEDHANEFLKPQAQLQLFVALLMHNNATHAHAVLTDDTDVYGIRNGNNVTLFGVAGAQQAKDPAADSAAKQPRSPG